MPAETKPQTARRSRREELLEFIAQEKARLARFEAEEADCRNRLGALQTELESLSVEPAIRARLPLVAETPPPKTSVEKVKVFRSLFRGREDVFPKRFVSKKTGKPGYAPACRNKFTKGVCGLPKVKCSECSNQAFIPFDDAAVVAHLTGRHVMGVYPLLEDETCWFLAVDFDKSEWKEDVGAFVETCRRVGLPVAVERSRSGNGAHVWFFFSAPVASSGAASVLEGNADPVHGPPPPPASRQEGSSHLRLCRPRRPDVASDVREAAARVPRHRLREGRGATGLRGAGDEVAVEYDEDVLRSLKERDDFT